MIAIIDYGMGNLRSVQKALEFCGASVTITNDPHDILAAEKVVLPGVGAFGRAMENLEKRKIIPVITEIVRHKKPFLGICLGMQLLLSSSSEFGSYKGLDLIKGTVDKFDERLPVPQMGWNTVKNVKAAKLFAGLGKEFMTYFVHSYYVNPQEPVTIGETEYGIRYCSALEKDSVYGLQFHPEKSGDVGLHILRNFIAL